MRKSARYGRVGVVVIIVVVAVVVDDDVVVVAFGSIVASPKQNDIQYGEKSAVHIAASLGTFTEGAGGFPPWGRHVRTEIGQGRWPGTPLRVVDRV